MSNYPNTIRDLKQIRRAARDHSMQYIDSYAAEFRLLYGLPSEIKPFEFIRALTLKRIDSFTKVGDFSRAFSRDVFTGRKPPEFLKKSLDEVALYLIKAKVLEIFDRPFKILDNLESRLMTIDKSLSKDSPASLELVKLQKALSDKLNSLELIKGRARQASQQTTYLLVAAIVMAALSVLTLFIRVVMR